MQDLYQSWKLAYFFLNSTFKTDNVKKDILEVVVNLQEIGNVIGFTSDIGSNFVQMSEKLTNDHILNNIIFCFFDSPHILKAVRNNFVT